ncbi:MAG: mannose-1-phosphate guanylyltransferase/mannose-6-phosphate isomerase [Leptospirillia bacterium]
MVVPVILAGGVGSRLWPLSRELYPKQLLPLVGNDTMLQSTVGRLAGLDAAAPLVVVGEEHRFMVAEQLRGMGVTAAAILLEPAGRNTAPAVATAALTALALASADDDPVLLVLPADHVIADTAAFHTAVRAAALEARQGRLVTFGIEPVRAETGYGYIQRGAARPGGDAFEVARFVEKPDEATAHAFLAAGDYLWNSGMFAFSARSYLDALGAHAPDMLAACTEAVKNASHDLDFTRLDESSFSRSPSDSIDYAVMEKSGEVSVVPVSMGWNDVGSWQALWEVSDPDSQGNVLVGDVIAEGVTGSYVRAESRLVGVVGLSGHVVVETADSVLVAPMDRVQDVKKLVTELKQQGRDETRLHSTVYRPWGSYTVLEISERHQVKRITVNPGASLSLQMHHHRAEHWVVVVGSARVTRGDDTFLLGENESTYIPVETRHRLENPGTEPLEMIEVQSGAYLGEDDIVRFDDKYGRKGT